MRNTDESGWALPSKWYLTFSVVGVISVLLGVMSIRNAVLGGNEQMWLIGAACIGLGFGSLYTGVLEPSAMK